MATEKLDPIELAHQFMSLNADDFRMFWAMVSMEWSHEDSDLDAIWFYHGQQMNRSTLAAINALRGAVAGGIEAGKDKR